MPIPMHGALAFPPTPIIRKPGLLQMEQTVKTLFGVRGKPLTGVRGLR